MIQPKKLLDSVAALVAQHPGSIDDIRARLAAEGIAVPVGGLRHVMEGAPTRFRRDGEIWTLIGQGQGKPKLPPKQEQKRATGASPRPQPVVWASSERVGACSVCGIAHRDSSSYSLTSVWR